MFMKGKKSISKVFNVVFVLIYLDDVSSHGENGTIWGNAPQRSWALFRGGTIWEGTIWGFLYFIPIFSLHRAVVRI